MPQLTAWSSQAAEQREETKQSPGVLLNLQDRDLSSESPRQLEFVKQIPEGERATQREFKSLSEDWEEHR